MLPDWLARVTLWLWISKSAVQFHLYNTHTHGTNSWRHYASNHSLQRYFDVIMKQKVNLFILKTALYICFWVTCFENKKVYLFSTTTKKQKMAKGKMFTYKINYTCFQNHYIFTFMSRKEKKMYLHTGHQSKI